MTEDAKQSLTAIVVVLLFFGAGFLALHFFRDHDLPEWGRWAWLLTGLVVVVRLVLAARRRRRNGAHVKRRQGG